jgi:hypothetical protein
MSTLPNDVVPVDTVAGPVGALVTGVVHEGELASALTDEVKIGPAASRPMVSTAAVAGRETSLRNW